MMVVLSIRIENSRGVADGGVFKWRAGFYFGQTEFQDIE